MRWWILAAAVVLAGMAAAEERPEDLFARAEALRAQGKVEEAFRLFFHVPGGEAEAARLGRADAARFLALLPDGEHLVHGDLLLARGERAEALAQYRLAARGMPANAYPVEPPEAPSTEFPRFTHRGPALPFRLGPGSHRDNWLIRRFLALEAWEDAEREFARVRLIHCERAGDLAHAGYDGKGLQFALDYAYFLKQRRRPDEARAVLLEPLTRIDMDRNPNLRRLAANNDPAQMPVPTRVDMEGPYRGVSRKEFLRLAYGEFAAQGKEAELLAAVQRKLDTGDNRARRVLARLHLHRGEMAEALAWELAYLAHGDFDALTVTYRRGLVFEELQRPDDAVTAFEAALDMPYTPPRLPDADEEAWEMRQMSAAAFPARMAPGGSMGQPALVADLVTRLLRLYGARGETGKALDLSLRSFALNPGELERFDAVMDARRRFAEAGQAARFQTWAAARAREAAAPAARANLCWAGGDLTGAARAVAERAPEVYERRQWKERFRQAGTEPLRLLLTELVKADPRDGMSRLELLDLEKRLVGPEAIAALESLLEDKETGNAFSVGKGIDNRTQFRDYFDLGARLARLYAQHGQLDKLHALGLRVARGEWPFDAPATSGYRLEEQWRYRNGNALPEDVETCLALAITHADTPAKQAALAAALANAPWEGARAQLARRREGAWPRLLAAIDAPRAFGWANLPAGTTVLASVRNVHCLTRDDRHLYAGHPWGVAVYTLAGKSVTRVYLGSPVRDLALLDGALWAAADDGLFRIDAAFAVARLAGFTSREEERPALPCALAVQGDLLWIGTSQDVRAFNPKTRALRVYSPRELGLEHGARWRRFLIDGAQLWVDGDAGCRRYDPRADAWHGPVSPEPRYPIRLLGVIDGRLWGQGWVNEKLRARPCLLDRETLATTFILIEDAGHHGPLSLNGPFSYFGTLDGKPVFGDKHPRYVYDASGKLLPLDTPQGNRRNEIACPLPPGLRTGTWWTRPDGAIVCDDDMTHHHDLLGRLLFAEGWTLLTLPDGTRVLGARGSSRLHTEMGLNDQPDGAGGLYVLSTAGEVREISAEAPADTLPADEVFDVVADDYGKARPHEQVSAWVCTAGGLAPLDAHHQPWEIFSRRSGLPSNTIFGGVAPGDGKVYFASRWGDNGGGLIIFDHATGVFRLLAQADGLAANAVERVTARPNGTLDIGYGVQYRRYLPRSDYKYHQYPPSIYHFATGAFSPPGEPNLMEQPAAYAAHGTRVIDGTLPCLGGALYGQETLGGKRYLYGARGLVILEPGAPAPPPPAEIAAGVTRDPHVALLREALAWRPGGARQLGEALAHENPYLRAQALSTFDVSGARLSAEALPRVFAALDDPAMLVRATALCLLSRAPSPEAVPLLRKRLADEDPYIRAVAAIILCRQGEMPEIRHLREMLAMSWRDSRYGNFPFGAQGSFGIMAGPEHLFPAVAPHATPEVFALLLDYPPYPRSGDYARTVFPALGASLRKYPEAAALLLTAYNAEEGPGRYRAEFAEAVFVHAGTALLPALHAALASEDRVVRANAARACGALGDATAIPLLLKALEMESGLARAAIVSALGRLQAVEALPRLAELYVDVKNDERRRAGAGYRLAQAQAQTGAQYEALRSLDAIGGEWDELKASARRPLLDPARNEPLLTPGLVLEAVAAIGAQAAQPFYRVLAGEKDASARAMAAVYLAVGADRATNLPILRNLLADGERDVRLQAGISLFLLGDAGAEARLLGWLTTGEPRERGQCVTLLHARQPDRARLAPLRPALAAIAADLLYDTHVRDRARRLAE